MFNNKNMIFLFMLALGIRFGVWVTSKVPSEIALYLMIASLLVAGVLTVASLLYLRKYKE